MEKVTETEIEAYGKVNLSLNITGVCGAMHTLESVVAKVDIFDRVRISFNLDKKISVNFDLPEIGENNTAVKAVKFLQSFCPDLGATVFINKGIPVSGGLGGSSADAAAIISAAIKLMPQQFDKSIVSKSVCVGSDVPALICGNCVIMRGVGEDVTPVVLPKLHLVIANGGGGVNSGEAYREFDNMYASKSFCPANTNALISALNRGEINCAAKYMNNALTLPAIKLNPVISDTLNAVKAHNPAAAFMTGSGSCCVGIFESESAARSAAENLQGSMWAAYASTLNI